MKTFSATFPLQPVQFTFASFPWPRYLATLPQGSKVKRLERYKSPVCGPYMHAPRPEQAGKGPGFYLGDDPAPFRLRWRYCDEVATSIRHTGWFADDYQDDKFRGLVFRLPRGRGFLTGWTMGEGMSSVVDGYIYDDELSAALAADSMAEKAADDEREAREKEEQAQREAEECAESEELESSLFCNA